MGILLIKLLRQNTDQLVVAFSYVVTILQRPRWLIW